MICADGTVAVITPLISAPSGPLSFTVKVSAVVSAGVSEAMDMLPGSASEPTATWVVVVPCVSDRARVEQVAARER